MTTEEIAVAEPHTNKLEDAAEAAKEALVRKTIERCKGNLAASAKKLKMHRATLARYVDKYKLRKWLGTFPHPMHGKGRGGRPTHGKDHGPRADCPKCGRKKVDLITEQDGSTRFRTHMVPEKDGHRSTEWCVRPPPGGRKPKVWAPTDAQARVTTACAHVCERGLGAWMPSTIAEQSVAASLVTRGYLERIDGCRHEDTGREGPGYKLTDAGIELAQKLAEMVEDPELDESAEEHEDDIAALGQREGEEYPWEEDVRDP